MVLKFRPLNKVSSVMQHVGFEPGYAYDDLVFSDNAVFLIQFHSRDATRLILYFNEDCNKNVAMQLESGLKEAAHKEGFSIDTKGTFSLSQEQGDEDINIRFVETVES
jgi:hypothetical protein